MQPIAPETPDRFTQVMVPLTVGVASALLVFSVLVFLFGDRSPAPVPSPPTGVGSPGTTPSDDATASPDPARVVRGSVRGDVEPAAVTVSLRVGDALRVKVVPDPAFDPQIGITMPKDAVVADYFQKGFKGDVQRLFPIQNGVLYGDTLTPSASVALAANDLGKEGAAEWLVLVAPTTADYAVVVRGRGASAGAYTLTLQRWPASAKAAAARRLDGQQGWLDREAARQLAKDDLAFLDDAGFYADAEFRTDGDDTRPTPQAIDSMIATGT